MLDSALPGQILRLEDVISQCIDWTRAPVKILLAYGASRAGKGLILRVIANLLGRGNYSAVTLHQLAENRFMAAELFGKLGNIAGELKPDEVRDISLLKMLTGEDPIQADKKYGQTFSFYNKAFLAFSCNKLPPVNETTKAFVTRCAPFRFEVGHHGREDTTLDAKLTAEIPGILVRLVAAWQRRQERGNFLPVDEPTAIHFAQNIDHVARFLRDRTVPVEKVGDGVKRAELFDHWMAWCRDQNLAYAAKSSKQNIFEKVRNHGVEDKKDRGGTYRWMVAIRREDSDRVDDGKPDPADGKTTATDGNPSEKSAVTKTAANTKEVEERRQRRQPFFKTPESLKTPAEKAVDGSKVEKRYVKGAERLPSLPSFSGAAPVDFSQILFWRENSRKASVT